MPEKFKEQSGEIPKQAIPEQEPEIEQELSPEVIEEIMRKVQDINTKGIAYSGVPEERLQSILRHGLLGTDYHGTTEGEIDKETWKANVRKRKGQIYFNIVGRAYDISFDSKSNRYNEYGETEIGASEWMKHDWNKRNKIALLFDVSSFHEEPPITNYHRKKFKNRTFAADWDTLAKIWKEKVGDGISPGDARSLEKLKGHLGGEFFTSDGFPKPWTEHGFLLNSRVAPRLLNGIVVKGIQDTDEHLLKRIINQITSSVKKESRLLPIYDTHGNLLFPKKMTYDEVKKLVTKKDREDKFEEKE